MMHGQKNIKQLWSTFTNSFQVQVQRITTDFIHSVQFNNTFGKPTADWW